MDIMIVGYLILSVAAYYGISVSLYFAWKDYLIAKEKDKASFKVTGEIAAALIILIIYAAFVFHFNFIS